jgi:hypothetical protein
MILLRLDATAEAYSRIRSIVSRSYFTLRVFLVWPAKRLTSHKPRTIIASTQVDSEGKLKDVHVRTGTRYCQSQS